MSSTLLISQIVPEIKSTSRTARYQSVEKRNMAAEAKYEIERYLQPIEIVHYFHENQRSSNHDLIKHFRPLLVESSLAKENHEFLKKVTAKLVIIKKIQGQKVLELKAEFKSLEPWEILQNIDEGHKEAKSLPRSRVPIYEPTSLEKEEDYFVTPKDALDEVIEEQSNVAAEEIEVKTKKKKRISSKRKASSRRKALMTIDEDVDEVFEEADDTIDAASVKQALKEVSCQKCLDKYHISYLFRSYFY